tara:strand:- start:108 stop:329 length:222 start_codon:yes stop_codon:yes gene_type:complete
VLADFAAPGLRKSLGDMTKRLAIIGGGSAGWMAAAYLHTEWPLCIDNKRADRNQRLLSTIVELISAPDSNQEM